MNLKTVGTVVGSILLGLVYFGIVMGLAMGLVTVNASVSPDFAWFPFTNTAIVILAIWLAQKYRGIGLEHPADIPWGRVYVIGTGLTVLGIATAVVQGKFTGYTRATEILDPNVGAGFALTYAIYMSTFAAVLAEATFRGVIQTRMQSVLSVWPVVIIIGIVNVLAHRWGPEITLNWLGLFVTLAGWTYLRWLSRSLWPPLILHTVVNFIVALGLWYRGPFVHAELANGATIAVTLAGLAGLIVAISLSKGVNNS